MTGLPPHADRQGKLDAGVIDQTAVGDIMVGYRNGPPTEPITLPEL
jgi:hypothetical protein